MLELKNIKKDYLSGEETVHALKGLTIAFRENEFVSILGQSGCGKTTLLNIIGGLDRYSSGDLMINGTSTKQFKDRDWDTYRNHSIGFVFQSYNLIPHQTVLSNVELALTLSGVSKAERRRRAKEALEKVGLGDQLKKKPNQMSGGQMQRVAIARALVNDPDILLADEPTGALDSETSVQVMELLKEIAKDKLVIMVTHNPELAQQYSTRIVRLLDGEVISDSMPYEPGTEEEKPTAGKENKGRKTSMSFFTALSLSLNNLMTKKGRTILTAFAGSIGIIGIALILSLSSGMQNYIDKMEEETLTSYPISIQQASVDMTSMMGAMINAQSSGEEHEPGSVYSASIMTDMIESMMSQIATNDLKSFKSLLEEDGNEIAALCSQIQYTYPTEIDIYTRCSVGDNDDLLRVNPVSVLDNIGLGEIGAAMNMNNISVCKELVDNQTMRENDYELITGVWPEKYNEVMLVVNNNYEITDYTLYALGLLEPTALKDAIADAQTDLMENGVLTKDVEIKQDDINLSYEELMNLDLRLVLPTDYFVETDTGFADKREDEAFMDALYADAEPLKIVGVARSTSEDGMEYGCIAYTSALTEYVISGVQGSDIYRRQEADPDTDVFTGLPFPGSEAAIAIEKEEAAERVAQEAAGEAPAEQSFSAEQQAMLEGILAQMPEAYQAQFAALPPEEQVTVLAENGVLDMEQFTALAGENAPAQEEKVQRISDSSYEENIQLLHAASLDEPNSISLYAASFEDKEAITDALDAYNDEQTAAGKDEKVIHYTDYVGLLMSSVTRIVNIVSYVLIAFVGISLVVSSIMIGVITLISVQERTKEIGILRSIGASKRDVSRVFNAETLIIGLGAGLIGIGMTLLLNIPINMIIDHLAGIDNVSQLPPAGGAILVVISVLLTMLAGLIPSKAAARKDPVEALRTE
ncbi:MAG: ABC transporter ATP-binding protein/permease [Oscillospiraceae bacterium]|nr:ABC transporter ATP-binding protein/permease [Oscillospiraceae bacterium]